MKKKLLAMLLSVTVVGSMVACGSSDQSASTDTTVETQSTTQESAAQEEVQTQEAEEQTAEAAAASIDFEDGVYGFAGMDSAKGNSDASEMSIVDYNGSKALKVDVQSKVPYVALNLDGLLGDNISKVKTITFDVGVDNAEDGSFYANSGRIYAYSGEDLNESYDEWSVYMENSNPKTATAVIEDSEAFVAGAGNYIVISKETDNAMTKTGTPVDMYIDNISFLDADGNVLEVDKTAEYVAASSGKDLSNLAAVSGAVEFEGFSCSGDAWAQSGFTVPQEIWDALVPGSVVEVEFSSENGDMWIVMPEAAAGWMRVGDGTNGKAYINNSKNVAQITYEQIVEFCGEDKTTWGTQLQCEASGAWEVFAVRVGQKTPVMSVTGGVEFEGFSCSGDAWAQNGFDMPQEILDALVPGSAIEVNFKSDSGKLWIVMPAAEAGWMRVGDGNNGSAAISGDKCYVTYEQIAEFCGEDKATWGLTLQAESDTPWEVYAVKVGPAAQMQMVNNNVEFSGFSCAGDAWAQNGFDMPQEILDALVPGSVVTINYKSESGKMWLVMPAAEAGWMRVGDGTNGTAACDGSICQIPYEMIVEYCGEDISTWGATMQGESDTAWEVYSVSVGTGLVIE